MRHEISVSEFSPVVREFASYKTVIQGCSQRTAEQYLIDLRTFFRYLLCEGDAKTLHDPEKFMAITVESVEDEHFISIPHPMTKQHFISFVAFVTSDRIQMVKFYPEGNAETRLQLRGRGHLYYYCNQHGLFKKKV